MAKNSLTLRDELLQGLGKEILVIQKEYPNDAELGRQVRLLVMKTMTETITTLLR
jgi:hypothetical protein